MNLSHNSTCLTVFAPAKVNWYLELLGRRDDGFHQIETFMSTVSLFDTISFSVRQDAELKLRVIQSHPTSGQPIPSGPDNLVLRAADAVRANSSAHGEQGFNILLQKKIPSAAGLGGASSDAAATIKAMNVLLGSPLKDEQLHGIAASIGSDVPFFLRGGTAFCEGRGEIISSVEVPAVQWIVIGKPSTGLSTPEVYSRVRITKTQRDARELGEGLKNGRAAEIGRLMHNRLQQFAIPMNEEVRIIQNEFRSLQNAGKCCGHQLSGSGSSYFGLFRSQRLATAAASRLRGRLPGFEFYCCRMIGSCGLGNSDHGAMAA
jgi:4-diphosphocytidyl-2-C-methyl-D-erythritol kinase